MASREVGDRFWLETYINSARGFRDIHLNSVNPKAAAKYYPKPFSASATKTTFNGYEAVKTGNIYLLLTKVSTPPQNELTEPQTAVWHFGWNTRDSRKYN